MHFTKLQVYAVVVYWVLIVALWYVAIAAMIWFEFGSTLYA